MNRARKSDERGQTLIEFAMALPFLLLLVLLFIDFGIALDRRIVVQHAVREGARQGAVGKSVSEIEDQVVEQSQGVIDQANVTVCVDDGPDDNTSKGDEGDVIRVSASFTYDFSPGSGGLLPAFLIDPASLSITMTPSSGARLENPASGIPNC